MTSNGIFAVCFYRKALFEGMFSQPVRTGERYRPRSGRCVGVDTETEEEQKYMKGITGFLAQLLGDSFRH